MIKKEDIKDSPPRYDSDFFVYNVFTGEKMWWSDGTLPQLGPYGEIPEKYKNMKAQYCEGCGIKSEDLYYITVVSHHTYMCENCKKIFLGG